MAASGSVTPIDVYRGHSSTGSGGVEDPPSSRRFEINVQRNTSTQPDGVNILSVDELYRSLESQDGRVIQAIRLLNECGQHLRAAMRVDIASDFIDFDEEVMRAKDSLRKLYALRAIGDGFGAVVNAIICAFANKDPEAPATTQMSTVIEVLRQLRKRPMLHFDSSMNLLDQLEDSGLNIEPPFFELLTEAIE